MLVFFFFSGTDVGEGPITRPDEFYRVCACVCVCLCVSLSVIKRNKIFYTCNEWVEKVDTKNKLLN